LECVKKLDWIHKIQRDMNTDVSPMKQESTISISYTIRCEAAHRTRKRNSRDGTKTKGSCTTHFIPFFFSFL